MIGPHLPVCTATRSFPPTAPDECWCSPVSAPVEPLVLAEDGCTVACSSWRQRFGWNFHDTDCPRWRARLETLAA